MVEITASDIFLDRTDGQNFDKSCLIGAVMPVFKCTGCLLGFGEILYLFSFSRNFVTHSLGLYPKFSDFGCNEGSSGCCEQSADTRIC